MPYNSYRFSCEHVQLKRLSFLSKLSIILNCHSKKGPFLSMGEGILCQTAAGLARHTHARSCTLVHTHGTHTHLPSPVRGRDDRSFCVGLSHGFGGYRYFLNFCCSVCVPFCGALRTWGRWAPWGGVPTCFWEQPQHTGVRTGAGSGLKAGWG